MNERSTSDTDAATSRLMCNVSVDFARKLKYERDEARADAINLRRMSVVELMGENLNVKNHVTDWENRCLRAERERDEERKESLEQARLLGISGERECRLIAERDEANKKYDIEATEHMLNINKCCNQRDEAINALMKIEEIFIDGDDTYENWKSMGQIARTFLENNI